MVACFVLPMYMGVILKEKKEVLSLGRAPHVYGGDPLTMSSIACWLMCSPCIWG